MSRARKHRRRKTGVALCPASGESPREMGVHMTDTDVVGWGAAHALSDAPMTVSRAIAVRLLELGVKDGFGVLGGGIAPFAAGVDQTALRFHSFHHRYFTAQKLSSIQIINFSKHNQ